MVAYLAKQRAAINPREFREKALGKSFCLPPCLIIDFVVFVLLSQKISKDIRRFAIEIINEI